MSQRRYASSGLYPTTHGSSRLCGWSLSHCLYLLLLYVFSVVLQHFHVFSSTELPTPHSCISLAHCAHLTSLCIHPSRPFYTRGSHSIIAPSWWLHPGFAPWCVSMVSFRTLVAPTFCVGSAGTSWAFSLWLRFYLFHSYLTSCLHFESDHHSFMVFMLSKVVVLIN